MSDDPLSIPKKIQEILFRYRATPIIDKNAINETIVRQLSEGDRVQARYYSTNKSSWKIGTIIKKLGKLHYIV